MLRENDDGTMTYMGLRLEARNTPISEMADMGEGWEPERVLAVPADADEEPDSEWDFMGDLVCALMMVPGVAAVRTNGPKVAVHSRRTKPADMLRKISKAVPGLTLKPGRTVAKGAYKGEPVKVYVATGSKWPALAERICG